MDVKEEPLELEEDIIDVPEFVELTCLEKIKNENVEIKVEPIELVCGDCNEKFTDEVALKIHEMFHSKTNYCFVCKRVMRLNFHDHIVNRHLNHVCGICNKVLTLKKTLDNHIRSHTKERIFKCDKCDKSFMQRGALTSHVTSTHEGIKPYVCQICDGTFTTSSSLKKHIRKMHTGNEVYECRICLEKFVDKKRKWDHERKHTHSKECEICGKIFKKSDSKSKHLVTKHFKTEECIYCKKMFHKSLIDAHIVEIHEPRHCDDCDMTFYDARLFNNHRLSHIIRVMCTLCGRNYKEEDMDKHLQLHREDKIKKCDICKTVFLDIERHNLRVHKNTKYSFCHLCPEKFLTLSSKSRHVFRVHLTKLGKHLCNFCGKRFNESANLRKHLITHYRMRPYKCLMCKKGFKYLHKLENHKKEHDLRITGMNYKFICATCGRKFKIEMSLRQHKCLPGKFECRICGLKYRAKYYLKRHLITYHSPTVSAEETINNHHSTKSILRNSNILRGSAEKYQCKKCKIVFTHCNTFKKHFCNVQHGGGYNYSLCRKKYKTKKDAVHHIEGKRAEKELKCDICEYVCSDKVSMRKHYVRTHVFRDREGQLIEHCTSEDETKYVPEDIYTKNVNIKINVEEYS